MSDYTFNMNEKMRPYIKDDQLFIDKYINDTLTGRLHFEESVIKGAVVAYLRTLGYTVLEPGVEDADYREIFGRDPEPWREPLGALRLTLTGEPENVDVKRAQHEVEWLVRVLNGVEG